MKIDDELAQNNLKSCLSSPDAIHSLTSPECTYTTTVSTTNAHKFWAECESVRLVPSSSSSLFLFLVPHFFFLVDRDHVSPLPAFDFNFVRLCGWPILISSSSRVLNALQYGTLWHLAPLSMPTSPVSPAARSAADRARGRCTSRRRTRIRVCFTFFVPFPSRSYPTPDADSRLRLQR